MALFRKKQKKEHQLEERKWTDILFYSLSILVIIILLFVGMRQRGWLPLWIDNAPSSQISQTSQEDFNRRAEFHIINAHEHVQSEDNIPLLRKVMKDCQVERIVMLGTSDFTFFLDPKYGFTGYDENNEFIIKMSQEYPDEFAALVTLDPRDVNKLDKLKKYIHDGAAGVKLYNGHGSFYDLYFNLPLDDVEMMEVYAFCEQEDIPILYHINTGRFLAETEHILKEYSDLKIIVPHFMLSSGNLTRLIRLMSDYPNLYTDISFGHPDFLVAGFKRISDNYMAFRDFMVKYRDRITYGTDIVVTTYKAKNRTYLDDIHLAYMDFLEKDEFALPADIYKMMSSDARKNYDPNQIYKGLNLEKDTLQMIYHDNAKKLFF